MSERKQSKIDPTEFMNTAEELHAVVIGLGEVVCPWPPLQMPMSEERLTELRSEWHYYMLGRILGIFAWLGIAAIIKGVFF